MESARTIYEIFMDDPLMIASPNNWAIKELRIQKRRQP